MSTIVPSISVLADTNLHPVSGEFRHPEVEQAFWRSDPDGALADARWGWGVLSLVALLMAIPDVLWNETPLAASVLMRISAILPGIILLRKPLQRPERLAPLMALVLAWAGAHLIALVFVSPLFHDKAVFWGLSMPLSLALWNPIRFRATLLFNLWFGPTMVLSAAYKRGTFEPSDGQALIAAFTVILIGQWMVRMVNQRLRKWQLAAWHNARLVREKERLMTSVAHELRTPLSSSMMAVAAFPAEARNEPMVEVVEAQLRRLSAIVDGVMQLGELQHGGRLKLDGYLEVRDLLEAVADDLDKLQRGPRVEIGDCDDAQLNAHIALLRSALTSMGNNALRFATTRVVLSAKHVDGHLELRVDDDGPGIPEAQRESVFQPLGRLKHHAGGHGVGLGVGLSIARAIAEGHGGTATAMGSPLGGARLVIALPHALTSELVQTPRD